MLFSCTYADNHIDAFSMPGKKIDCMRATYLDISAAASGQIKCEVRPARLDLEPSTTTSMLRIIRDTSTRSNAGRRLRLIICENSLRQGGTRSLHRLAATLLKKEAL